MSTKSVKEITQFAICPNKRIYFPPCEISKPGNESSTPQHTCKDIAVVGYECCSGVALKRIKHFFDRIREFNSYDCSTIGEI